MAKLENPAIEVRVYGVEDWIITSEIYMDFDIAKDIYEEPNEANLIIYNLSEDKRGKLAMNDLVETPIEIFLTGAGSTDLVKAFAGEIDTVKSMNMRPGHSTKVHAIGQKSAHYSAYVEGLTFSAGTPAAQIILALAEPIGLPQQFSSLPAVPIVLSQSFTGNAFDQLEKFCRDYGYRVFVLDGTLRITSIYIPQNLTPKVILPNVLLSAPIQSTITDEELMERHSISESAAFDSLPGIAKKKKKTKNSRRKESTDYITYSAVDKRVEAWEFQCLCQPDVQPDDLVTCAHPAVLGKLLRVREVNHYGNNETFDDWTTEIITSVYEAL